MIEQERIGTGSSTGSSREAPRVSAVLPLIVSVKTGLTGDDDALCDKLPVDYAGKTVGEAITYLTSKEQLSDGEKSLATSVNNELSARGVVVTVNGRTAKLTDRIESYLVDKTHGSAQYRELKIDVASVQQGGKSLLYCLAH